MQTVLCVSWDGKYDTDSLLQLARIKYLHISVSKEKICYFIDMLKYSFNYRSRDCRYAMYEFFLNK